MRIEITSEPANVAGVRTAVVDTAREIGFNDSDAGTIALAVDEAVCNCIRHGYQGRGGQPIEVTLERVDAADGAALRIIIRDWGRQVSPDRIIGRDLKDIRPGGLGTHIINSVMDTVEYARGEPEGMQVTMVKRVPTGPTTDGASPCSA